MEMIKIPHTDLEVSRLALGCMGLGRRLGSRYPIDERPRTAGSRSSSMRPKRSAPIFSIMPISMAVEGPKRFSAGR